MVLLKYTFRHFEGSALLQRGGAPNAVYEGLKELQKVARDRG